MIFWPVFAIGFAIYIPYQIIKGVRKLGRRYKQSIRKEKDNA